jgi:sporulation protein YlmC with PRC-barrel domain
MSEFPIHAQVECADGPCGKSLAVIVDQQTREVTHIALEDKSLPHAPYQRLLPVDQVAETSPDLIRLHCTRDDVDRMEPFTHTRYVPKAQEDYTLYEGGEGAARHDMWGEPSTVGEVEVKIVEEYVPAGELAVHPGTHVEATNGRIGIVEELIVDPATEEVTHFALEEGHLWGKKEVTIPLSAVDRVEGDTVYLKLDKAAVEGLPTIPRKRH